jgi:hypothetical protein
VKLWLCSRYATRMSSLSPEPVTCSSPYHEGDDPALPQSFHPLSVLGLPKPGGKPRRLPQGDLQTTDTNITISAATRGRITAQSVQRSQKA